MVVLTGGAAEELPLCANNPEKPGPANSRQESKKNTVFFIDSLS
jgi:hypothetical protein